MSGFTASDSAHMAHALRLAARAEYTAHPNPMVGCVLVADEELIGEGWHVRTGEAHAEVNALKQAGDRARGSTAYVTLEPCAHHGRTPPCADALIEAGIGKLVVAMRDPFEDVAGKGIRKIEEAGIEVAVGLMKSAAADLNAGYLSRVTRGRPLLRLKLASSLDGAIAMKSGESQWITGPEARADVQRLRAKSGAVVTGIGTVLADDPSLNVRSPELAASGLQPIRVVLDSRLRMPLAAGMLALPGSTLVCCAGDNCDERKKRGLEASGAQVMVCSQLDGHVDVREVLAELGVRGVNNALIEAGPAVAGALLENDLVDELVIYQAPHIMGSQTLGAVKTPSWSSLADRMTLTVTDTRRIGADTRITAKPLRKS